jgi:predicted PurR-regulated permease PerM
VLLIIGVPNVGALMVLIFVSALVPVIGNIVSGTTLALLAYQQKGGSASASSPRSPSCCTRSSRII